MGRGSSRDAPPHLGGQPTGPAPQIPGPYGPVASQGSRKVRPSGRAGCPEDDGGPLGGQSGAKGGADYRTTGEATIEGQDSPLAADGGPSAASGGASSNPCTGSMPARASTAGMRSSAFTAIRCTPWASSR
jgi:hypothetical protein